MRDQLTATFVTQRKNNPDLANELLGKKDKALSSTPKGKTKSLVDPGRDQMVKHLDNFTGLAKSYNAGAKGNANDNQAKKP